MLPESDLSVLDNCQHLLFPPLSYFGNTTDGSTATPCLEPSVCFELESGPLQELYPELVRLNAVPSLVGLLSHDNVDISTDVIDVIKDLTDSDAVEESAEEAQVLVDALLDNNVLELLVQVR